MIFAFSTSSPVASVAVFTENGDVLFSGEKRANMKASGACFELLEQAGFDPNQGTLFLADAGPGSFTGTRVGVTIAKTLAFVAGAKCASADAFDLISAKETVVIPSRKGEWFVREPGCEAIRTQTLPTTYRGFLGVEDDQDYPKAVGFANLLGSLVSISPELLVPSYLIEPSISVQKKSLGLSGGAK